MTTASPSCRRCSAPIGGLPVEPLAAHWSRHDDPNPGAYAGRRCARCSWANVVPPQWLWEEDLAGLAQLVDVRELDTSDTSDPALALQRIRLARGALVSRLRTLVLQDPASARFWLMGALRQVGPDRTDEDYRLVVFLQQVYACLLSRGPVELTGGAPASRRSPGCRR